eukprot:TRINITY_DN22710_c0_g1_i1.p1 TRINITY_DN22710_c0_g1~~TRINITY_DN22710_c0_g1_i1.p1  ORF type:complete len:146 (+),score=31.85 TRINITY_DN22710_c0_g1_i1:1-438(+)
MEHCEQNINAHLFEAVRKLERQELQLQGNSSAISHNIEVTKTLMKDVEQANGERVKLGAAVAAISTGGLIELTRTNQSLQKEVKTLKDQVSRMGADLKAAQKKTSSLESQTLAQLKKSQQHDSQTQVQLRQLHSLLEANGMRRTQ